ncbi:hypothetical protein NPIL_425911 [Nephila pilipes]|uniref:Uncharacterized protein n=1 Tax=Nephila pilipes TaxID=299642 RepID=A0A8X6NXC3_NEPPI|nr:hypothetical protein NPIL_425911 [Nephila pilipes]
MPLPKDPGSVRDIATQIRTQETDPVLSRTHPVNYRCISSPVTQTTYRAPSLHLPDVTWKRQSNCISLSDALIANLSLFDLVIYFDLQELSADSVYNI